jgi:hypothetical protein
LADTQQLHINYKLRCGNNCNKGFKLRMVRISALKAKIPVYECRNCGYWTLSSQSQVAADTHRVFANRLEYEDIVELVLKERT